jgi:dihydropteroate synthase
LTRIGDVIIHQKLVPKIMGIINLSPESFYKKSVKLNPDEIQDTVLRMQEDGADVIDIGGMSTAPYLKTTIPIGLEIERLQNAVSIIRQISDIPISIDTVRSEVLESLSKYDINALNDITGLKFDKRMPLVASDMDISIILGAYRINYDSLHLYCGDIQDTLNLLNESIKIAKNFKIDEEKLIVDPSIGFFRKEGNNAFFSKINGIDWYIRDLDIVSNVKLLRSIGMPSCISISRKSFMGCLFDLAVEDRLIPSIIAEAYCVINGVSLIRTHNVKETRLSLNMIKLLN